MLASTEKLLEKGFENQIFKEWSFASVFDGTPGKRYAIMNKALKKGEIVQLHRGVYILGAKYRSQHVSKFSIANRIISGSYISCETALSFHGWIPEKVDLVISMIAKGRTKSFSNMFGEFQYIKIAVNEYEFLSGIVRQELDGQPFLIAGPLRALADYVYIRKIKWTELNFLLDGMRIEIENLESLTLKDFDEVFSIYTSKRVLSFLHNLRKVLKK